MPSSRSTKPCAPASTTPACFSTGSSSGVLANDSCARARALVNSARRSVSPPSAASHRAAAKSSRTVGSVPGTGSDIAVQDCSAPRRQANARPAASTRTRSASASRQPWKNCAMMAPELPRAPSSAASVMRPRISGKSRWSASSRASRMDLNVKAMLVPVSPSGTGKTLMRSMYSRRPNRCRIPASITRTRPGPSSCTVCVVRSFIDSLRLPKKGAVYMPQMVSARTIQKLADMAATWRNRPSRSRGRARH